MYFFNTARQKKDEWPIEVRILEGWKSLEGQIPHCMQVDAEELATPMQTGEEPAISLPKRRKTNNVIGVGVVSLSCNAQLLIKQACIC